ncbi:MAG: hypothetical protein ABW039_05810 [Sphingobium sp.]
MRVAKWMTGSLVGIALLGTSVAAEARPRYGHGGGWHHRDRGDGFGVGDAIGIAALIGAVAIVASSASKDRKAARAADPRDLPPPDNSIPPPRTGTDYSHGGYAQDSSWNATGDYADTASRDEDAMTDACAVAAREEAQADGGYAEVRHVASPIATTHGYNIDGEVETRSSWRAGAGTTRRFTCSMLDGRVADVYLSRDVAAR